MHTLVRLFLLSCLLGMISTLSHADEHSALDKALDAQSDATKERYPSRNPGQTLEFFGIEAGMKVGEALPGGGWYSKILLSYLGAEGELVGVDYPMSMWQEFSFMNEERLKEKETWAEDWTAKAKDWGIEGSANVSAYTFENLPADESLDAMLFIRALHNMARFNSKIGSLEQAMGASFSALKPGGIVGIVQHAAREDRSDDWADGSSGYLKASYLIAVMEKAGFEFVGESDANANDLDQAKEGDVVWRLKPSLRGSEETKEARAAIGESNRMTLKFRKPS